MKFVSPLAVFGLTGLVSAANLATTTRYFDGQEGACGCGTSSGNFPWQLGISTGVYTAAASQALFDTAGASWCGGGCGKCYQLTSTGAAPCSTCGTAEPAGMSIIVMVTNLCPHNGNEQWCPAVGGTNQYGYSYHFDIMAQSEVFGDNPVVEFEPVPCPGQAVSDWETCVCNGQTASDETPVGIAAVSAASPIPNAPASTASTVNTQSPAADPPARSATVAKPPTSSAAPVSKALSTLSTVKASRTSVHGPAGSPKEHGKHRQSACAVPH